MKILKDNYSTLQVYQRSYSQVRHIPPKMSDKFESQHYLGATFPGANMVQGKNTLGYLLPAHSTHRKESTLINTHRSQNA
jgi:hypothetical protein